jgi:hypothetical protein
MMLSLKSPRPTSPIAAAKRNSRLFAAGLFLLAGISPAAAQLALIDRPDTPSSRARIPFPPVTGGCHHLVRDEWQKVPCASQEEMKKRPPLNPILVPAISATAPTLGVPPVTPITWGSVAVEITSDPALANESDSKAGSATNAYSIQINANHFICSTCSANYPLPGSKSGDRAWVQFGVQILPQDRGKPFANLCISEWDITLGAFNGTSSCVFPQDDTGLELTGAHAFIGATEVIGYYQCPASSQDQPPHCLHLLAYLPWAGQWWHVDAPDWYGLGANGNWNNVNGSIYGYGSGSNANFTNARLKTVVRAYSCFLGPDATGYFAVPCPMGTPMVASLDKAQYTKEGNNLKIDAAPTFACQGTECWIYYTSSAP